MAKIKYLDMVNELFEKSPVVDFRSIERIVGKTKKSNYAKLLVRNLLLKNKIYRLTKGFYTKHAETGLAAFCFKPAYLGLQDALSFHGLWEQETISIIITSRSVRPGIRKVMGNNVIIRKIDKKYLFGFEYSLAGIFYLPYSDIEKTFIDMVYFKQPLDKEVLANFKKKIDKKKLIYYLKAYTSDFKKRVITIYDKNKYIIN